MNHLPLKSALLVCLVFMAGAVIAQPPPAMNQTFVAKDNQNNIAKNRKVYVQVLIRQGNQTATPIWSENFETVSDGDGLFNIVVGRGSKFNTTLLDFGKIPWANGPFFETVRIAVAPSVPAPWWIAADNYVEAPTTELLSVPFAMYSANASVTNVNTSLQPGPPNTFLVTDSSGNVNWRTPQAANTTVTTVTNFYLNFATQLGQSVDIPANTTAVVSVRVEGVRKGDPIIVTPQDDYTEWAVYAAWVAESDIVKVRFANFTPKTVRVEGSQYKIVVVK